MAVSRLTEKGQVTIPKPIRDSLGLKSGDEVEFINDRGTIYIRRKVDIEAMKAAIEQYRPFFVEYEGREVDEIMDELRGPRLDQVQFEDEKDPAAPPSGSSA